MKNCKRKPGLGLDLSKGHGGPEKMFQKWCGMLGFFNQIQSNFSGKF